MFFFYFHHYCPSFQEESDRVKFIPNPYRHSLSILHCSDNSKQSLDPLGNGLSPSPNAFDSVTLHRTVRIWSQFYQTPYRLIKRFPLIFNLKSCLVVCRVFRHNSRKVYYAEIFSLINMIVYDRLMFFGAGLTRKLFFIKI